MGPIRCPEASVKDKNSTLCYTPEELGSHQHRGGSLKSRKTRKDGITFPNHFIFPYTAIFISQAPSLLTVSVGALLMSFTTLNVPVFD
jgi:hypothetical protein